MYNETLFFILATCSLPLFAFVLDMAENAARAKKKRMKRREQYFKKYTA